MAVTNLTSAEYPRYAPELVRLLPQEEDARDAVQDAFLSAFKGIDQFRGNPKLSTWLHRTTVNAAVMKQGSRRRRPEQPIDDLLFVFDEQGEWVSGTARAHASSRTLQAPAMSSGGAGIRPGPTLIGASGAEKGPRA